MILLIVCALLAQAQTRQQMGGVYYAYPAPKKPVSVKAPEGYTPFYISHYGRPKPYRQNPSSHPYRAMAETRRLIERFVDENPEAAASLLRNWLNEDWG